MDESSENKNKNFLEKAEKIAMRKDSGDQEEMKDEEMDFLNDPDFLENLKKDVGIAEEEVIRDNLDANKIEEEEEEEKEKEKETHVENSENKIEEEPAKDNSEDNKKI